MNETVRGDVAAWREGWIGVVELRRPPHNFFDNELIAAIGDSLEAFDADPECRVVILQAQGKNFCAGADFANRPATGLVEEPGRKHLYKEATRLFRTRKPLIAAVQGAAVGGGLGLALVADFRIAAPEARFVANFARLGFHPGFGLSVTLPRLVGPQKAALMFYTGKRVTGEEALSWGLADELAPLAELPAATRRFAEEIALSAPLAVLSIRETLRRGLADQVEAATERELVEQEWQRRTADFAEGVRASAERRPPRFEGR